MEQIRTRYAKNGDIHIAYQVFGEGDVDLVFVPGFISHIENYSCSISRAQVFQTESVNYQAWMYVWTMFAQSWMQRE